MAEDNKEYISNGLDMPTGNRLNFSSQLEESATRFNDFVAKARAAKVQENREASERSKQNLFIQWLNTDNHGTTDECNRIIRLKNVADWINDFFYWWEEIINEWDEKDFVQNWIYDNGDNEYWQMAYDYIADDSIVDCNPMPFYEKMWWVNSKPTESADTTSSWEADEESPILTDGNEWDIDSMRLTDKRGNEYKAEYPDDEWTVMWDILWWVIWTIQNQWWWIERQKDKGLNKLWLMSDEDYEIARKFHTIWKIENQVPWINENDFTYQAAQFLTEMSEMFIIWWWEASLADAAFTKYPWLAKVIWKAALSSKWGTRMRDLFRRWLQWWKDILLLDTMDWEDWSLTDFGVWALFNILTWWIFSKTKADKKINKWIMNSAPMKEAMKMLKDMGVDVSPEKVWEFINSRFTGTKEQIAEQARVRAKDAEKLLDALLGTSEEKFESKTITDMFTAVAEHFERLAKNAWEDTVEWTINREAAEKARSLIKDWDLYKPSEWKEALRYFSDELKVFTKKFAETNWTKVKDKYASMYREVKEWLEKIWEELWLWDIKNMNREIYTANKISEWVWKKDLAEQISSKLWTLLPVGIWGLWWAVYGYLTWDTSKGAFIWALIWAGGKQFKKLLQNTQFKSWMSNIIYKFNWEYKQNLLDWVEKNWMEKLSESAEKELQDLLQKYTDKAFWNKVYTDVLNVWWKTMRWEIGQEISWD